MQPVDCAPHIPDGRWQEVCGGVAEAPAPVPGVMRLDADPCAKAERTVIPFVDAIAEGPDDALRPDAASCGCRPYV